MRRKVKRSGGRTSLRRALLGIPALLSVLTTGCVRRYLAVDYDRPTAKLRAAVSIARVTDEPLSVTDPLQVTIDIVAPSDSVVALVLKSPLRYTDIPEPFTGRNAAIAGAIRQAYVNRGARTDSASDEWAPPLLALKDGRDSIVPVDSIRVCSVSGIARCDRVPAARANSLSVLTEYPGTDTTVHLLVYTPRDRRLERTEYRIRLQWVTLPAPAVRALRTAYRDSTVTKAWADEAIVHELTADSHFLRVNYWAVPWIAMGAIGLVLATVGSH